MEPMVIQTTPLTDASDVVQAFNGCDDRNNWRAVIAGARVAPQVRFQSQSNMVEIRLHILTGRVAIDFSKTACAWGDYMAAVRRSLFTVLTALKACGYPVKAPLTENEGLIRLEYEQATATTFCWVADLGDAWQDHEDKPFKALDGVL